MAWDQSNITLVERVTTLEKLVAKFVHRVDTATRKKDWRRTVGMFDGDPAMKDIIDEGRRVREAGTLRDFLQVPGLHMEDWRSAAI